MAVKGGLGEKSIRQILELSQKVGERSLPGDRDAIARLCSDINYMTDGLCELRGDGKGASPQVGTSKIIYSYPFHKLLSAANV